MRTKGVCKFCGKEFTKAGMIKHLATCKVRKEGLLAEDENKQTTGYFSLAISGKYAKEYWLLIEISEDATLKKLDHFLRDIWLECCGHLSMFMINGIHYESMPDMDMFGNKTKGLGSKLKAVIGEGMKFSHIYDFGSTTELEISVFDYRKGIPSKEKLRIMSRNKPPEILCDECKEGKKKTASYIDAVESDKALCEDCYSKFADENEWEDYFIAISNSPRCGVCAYEGSEKYDE